jgi:hypothetical protein
MRPALHLALAQQDEAAARSNLGAHIDIMLEALRGHIPDHFERADVLGKMMEYAQAAMEYGAAQVVVQIAERQARLDDLLFMVRSEF